MKVKDAIGHVYSMTQFRRYAVLIHEMDWRTDIELVAGQCRERFSVDVRQRLHQQLIVIDTRRVIVGETPDMSLFVDLFAFDDCLQKGFTQCVTPVTI